MISTMNERHGPITGIDVWAPLDPSAEHRRRYQHAVDVHVCVAGTVCEAHPDQGHPHYAFDGSPCRGAAIPCPFPGCPKSVPAPSPSPSVPSPVTGEG